VSANEDNFDVIILGGGPSGATAGMKLARTGRSVLILEKEAFPRFHVGESMMPIMLEMTRELGLGERCEQLAQVPKHGAEFAFPQTRDDESLRFRFDQSLSEGPIVSMNIERSHYDKLLLDGAREAGCDVRDGTRVQAIERLEHHDVAVRFAGGSARAKWLLDATGQATLLAKHLGTKQPIPNHRKTAFFGHFIGVERLKGDEEGYPTIVMFEEGWFWIIPINETVTSCGLVLKQDAVKRIDVPKDQIMRWAIERTPMMTRRLRNATFPEMTSSNVISDYSYKCKPYAGPGYFLVGDAAAFIDPIFSTGVAMGMAGAMESAKLIEEVDTGKTTPDAACKNYTRFLEGSSKHLFSLVNSFYDHRFRELMMNGQGPAEMQRAVVSMLAGHVFPKPAWRLVWRFRFMQLCAELQRVLPMVPKHKPYSLFDAKPEPVGKAPSDPSPAQKSAVAASV
jgi:flavin-dependent dehydrogenase